MDIGEYLAGIAEFTNGECEAEKVFDIGRRFLFF